VHGEERRPALDAGRRRRYRERWMADTAVPSQAPADFPPDVPYQDAAGFEWTERAFHLLEQQVLVATPRWADGVASVVVAGPCPRCQHHLVDRWVSTVVTGVAAGTRGLRGDNLPPEILEVDVTCGCGNAHPGVPEQATGCGVSFRIMLRTDGAADRDEAAS
jgi:hypothetical protein